MEKPGDLTSCSDQQFEDYVQRLNMKEVLETLGVLQREMSQEQSQFNELSQRINQLQDEDSAECEVLTAKLMASQSRLASLMSRNMKCFAQRNSVKNQSYASEVSDFEKTLPESPSPPPFLNTNGHTNGHNSHAHGHSSHNGTAHQGTESAAIQPSGENIVLITGATKDHSTTDSLEHFSNNGQNHSVIGEFVYTVYEQSPCIPCVKSPIDLATVSAELSTSDTYNIAKQSYDDIKTPKNCDKQTTKNGDILIRKNETDEDSTESSVQTESTIFEGSESDHITVSRVVSETTFTVRNIREELSKPESKKLAEEFKSNKNTTSQVKAVEAEQDNLKSGAILEIENLMKDLDANKEDMIPQKVTIGRAKGKEGEMTQGSHALLMAQIRSLAQSPSSTATAAGDASSEASRKQAGDVAVSWADHTTPSAAGDSSMGTLPSCFTGPSKSEVKAEVSSLQNGSAVCPVPPVGEASEGFTADDKIKDRITLRDWNPIKLLKDLYEIRLAPDQEEESSMYVNMEGYMEKLPLNKKKATLLKTWKKRYFRTKKGCLYYYEDHLSPDPIREEFDTAGNVVEKSSGLVQLGGGIVEDLGGRIIGIDDGRGHYLTLRCSTDDEMDKWMNALQSHTVEDIKTSWVKPVLHAPPHSKRKVIIIDIGSCSVRAGILGDKPSLPQLFFPAIMATDKNSGNRTFGFDALKSEVRSSELLSYPIRPSVKIDKFAVDMEAMEPLFDKVFRELQVEPRQYWLMFSTPGNFSDNIKEQFMDMFINKFQLCGVNIINQTLLSLYSYNATSGIVVDIGERLEILPVTDGYIVEGGMSRQPYGGHKITEFLNSSFTESKYRFFTDVEFQIVRLAMEKSCYVARDFNEESRNCTINPMPFKKTINLEGYDLPPGTWKHVTHDMSRFKSPEGLFNTEIWGMDNPSLPKLVQKAVFACPMDTRREMWRSIYLSGGVTQIEGFAERLQAELSKLVPQTVRVQVRASPQRYHSAYIGACTMANLGVWEQASISAAEWKSQGKQSLQKWHMY